MRLTDLSPSWVTDVRFSVPIQLGVAFNCPCCGRQKCFVPFANPIDPEELLASTNWRPPSPAWQRTGETFDTLTLSPSVDLSQRGHWHGHIIEGEVQTA